MLVAGTTFSRYWQIRVDQIPCGTLYTPPQGCLEYHMETYGNFKSFNFGINDNDYHHLGSQVDISTRISSYLHILISTQDYSVCIRRNSGMCKVAYKAADDGESFYTSQKPTTPAIRCDRWQNILTELCVIVITITSGPRQGRRAVQLTTSIFRMAATGKGGNMYIRQISR